MKHTLLLKMYCLVVATIFSQFTFAQIATPQPAAYNQKLQSSSLLFIENRGQVADAKGNLRPDILFTANSTGAKLYLSANSIHYQFTKTEYPKGYDPHKREPAKDIAKEVELQKQIKTSTHRFSLELQGANLHPTVTTEKQSTYTENYYLAHCPDGITGVHGYEKITYKNVYPKIDWVIYSKGGFMEYDFLVHPGGNQANIKLKVKNAESVNITADGELLMKTSLGEVREKAPVSYVDGSLAESHFKQSDDGTIGFDVQSQPTKELRIDPSVVWATYYGGSNNEEGRTCEVDSTGNIYLAGTTLSSSGIASGGYQNNYSADADMYLVKFNSRGSRMWATYYGSTGGDYIFCSVLDKKESIYIAGATTSQTGMAPNGFQNMYSGGIDGFIVKFASDGSRIWASYFGGDQLEDIFACTTDAADNIYLCGVTISNNNIALNGFQMVRRNGNDAFLVKFNSNGVKQWGTYYGGDGIDEAWDCAADTEGNVYMTGQTKSSSGIAFNGYKDTLSSEGDAFLVKFDSSGNRLWATYYGFNNVDFGRSCAVDNIGNIYVSGETASTSGIAVAGFQNTYGGGNYDAFLVKFNSSGNLLWATYYGGNGDDRSWGCAIEDNDVYITASTSSSSGIAFDGLQNTFGGVVDALLVKFNSQGNRIWATYYGGPGADNSQFCIVKTKYVYLTGTTTSGSGIAANGFQNSYSGGSFWGDAFLAKIDGGKSLLNLCPNGSITITSPITGTTYQWQIGVNGVFTNITGPTAQSQTLQLTNLPSSSYGYRYRCMVNNGYTDIYELKFANTWIGTTNSTWEKPANWSCGILSDGNTDVIINTGPVILNSNGICRTLTVRPGVSFTVAAGNTLTITH